MWHFQNPVTVLKWKKNGCSFSHSERRKNTRQDRKMWLQKCFVLCVMANGTEWKFKRLKIFLLLEICIIIEASGIHNCKLALYIIDWEEFWMNHSWIWYVFKFWSQKTNTFFDGPLIKLQIKLIYGLVIWYDNDHYWKPSIIRTTNYNYIILLTNRNHNYVLSNLCFIQSSVIWGVRHRGITNNQH